MLTTILAIQNVVLVLGDIRVFGPLGTNSDEDNYFKNRNRVVVCIPCRCHMDGGCHFIEEYRGVAFTETFCLRFAF